MSHAQTKQNHYRIVMVQDNDLVEHYLPLHKTTFVNLNSTSALSHVLTPSYPLPSQKQNSIWVGNSLNPLLMDILYRDIKGGRN